VTVEATMRTDQDFLLYPLATEEQPSCSACRKPMTIATHEARSDHPDFSTFRCQDCKRSERFVSEN
jgi:transposase-like protein